MTIDRRTFLKGGGAAAAGVALGGPFQGLLARGVLAQGPTINAPAPVMTPDLRDNVFRLDVPPGFQYRSFDLAGTTFTDGTTNPGTQDGMGSFVGGGGRTRLVRNHELNGSLTADLTLDVPTYDKRARGGTSTVLANSDATEVVSERSLAGTQMNCAGGTTPWGSWLSVEETVNGPDVFDDFTRPAGSPPTTYIQNARLQKRHGYLFEVPAQGTASATPVTAAGRFAHEACAVDPGTGSIYLTEDDFGFGSGFYRYDPPVAPGAAGKVEDGGTLWMLGISGRPQANLSGAQTRGTTYPVTWIRIEQPDITFPMAGGVPTVTNNQAIVFVAKQGWDDGAAVFSRLEGCVFRGGVVYFTATQGGGEPEDVDWVNSAEFDTPQTGFGNGNGQVWAYHPGRRELEVVYQSSGPDDLDLPDNIVTSPRGTLMVCEDNPRANTLQAVTKWGQLVPVAVHRERPGVEFAGVTFSPNGKTMFFNLQTSTNAMSVAMWGPWHQLGV